MNWDAFDEAATPVVEIYSEHGASEDDRGPYPMVTHSFGGRQTAGTVQAALARGLRFGFVASSDDHAGFPGAYGEGLMAVHADALTRAAVLDAIRARRTYALTGDRIEVEFTVDGAAMGATIAAGRQVEVTWAVRGRDDLDVVELIQDGAIVHRDHAHDRVAPDAALGAPCQLRLEWGWGPWTALALDRVTDWRFTVAVQGGRLLRAFPCLQSGPFDEERRHRFHRDGERLAVQSYTSRRGAYRENPNQSLVLEVAGGPDTALRVEMTEPVAAVTTARLADLVGGSRHFEVGPFPKETYQWHRVVPLAASSVTGRTTLAVPAGRSHVYLRARQRNGHIAWASPVFLNWDLPG